MIRQGLAISLAAVAAFLLIVSTFPAHAQSQSVEVKIRFQFTEPGTNLDGSPLTDLGHYEFVLDQVDAAGTTVLTPDVIMGQFDADNPAPAANSPVDKTVTLTYTMVTVPVQPGQWMQVRLKGCDLGNDPLETGPRCSDWVVSKDVSQVTGQPGDTQPAGPSGIIFTIDVNLN